MIFTCVLIFFNFVHFADDSSIYDKGDNFADLIESINGELTGIDHWLRGNKLSLNIGKTKFMIFSNNNFDVPILKIRDEQLEYVDKIKFLGVIVDSKLRFTDHIKGVCSKVERVCGIFNRLLFIEKRFFEISSEEHYLFCSSFQNINMFHLQETEEIFD